jgi:sugar phosphate isomerase/epimerase
MRRPIGLRIEHDESAPPARYGQALDAGFDGIELLISPHPVSGQPEGEAAARELLTDVGPAELKVVAVASYCATTVIEAAIEQVRALLNRAADFQACCLNLTLPPVRPGDGEDGFARYQDGLNFADRLLHEVRYEAESSGVAVALEAAAGGCLLSPVELCEMIDRANSWAVGACIDVVRIAQIGLPPDWLATLRRRVHAVRICDVSWADESPAGESSAGGGQPPVDLGAVSAVLDEVPYEGPIIASGPGEPQEIIARMVEAKLVDPA